MTRRVRARREELTTAEEPPQQPGRQRVAQLLGPVDKVPQGPVGHVLHGHDRAAQHVQGVFLHVDRQGEVKTAPYFLFTKGSPVSDENGTWYAWLLAKLSYRTHALRRYCERTLARSTSFCKLRWSFSLSARFTTKFRVVPSRRLCRMRHATPKAPRPRVFWYSKRFPCTARHCRTRAAS